jgi:carbamoyltransferase
VDIKNNQIIWGASGLSHDASISVIKNGKIMFASSSERYSRIKNDKNFNPEMIQDCLEFGMPNIICWYENPTIKFLRKLLIDHRWSRYDVGEVFSSCGINCKILYIDHHISHLCAGLYTCPWDSYNQTLGVVVDSVGEFKTLSVWDINEGKYKCIHSNLYPNSLGLFYSSITDLLGLKAQEEEYIMMGMAAYGNEYSKKYYDFFKQNFFDSENNLIVDLRRGCRSIFFKEEIEKNRFQIAKAAQEIYEDVITNILRKYINKTGHKKLIMSGGCALNCTANSKILSLVDDMWIFPNPGDSGSSLGSALAYYGNNIELENMYLGKDAKSEIDVGDLVNHIKEHKMAGVIYGKAEFGPRAFGHRSILADPRIHDIKDIVNEVKGREKFRPFAPMILEEDFNEYFYNIGKSTSYPYMQYTFKCKFPEKYPGIIHIDGTSRVQTVNYKNKFIYEILKKWKYETGCPMLLNTSLNIKGKPLLNTDNDSVEFKNLNIKIYG